MYLLWKVTKRSKVSLLTWSLALAPAAHFATWNSNSSLKLCAVIEDAPPSLMWAEPSDSSRAKESFLLLQRLQDDSPCYSNSSKFQKWLLKSCAAGLSRRHIGRGWFWSGTPLQLSKLSWAVIFCKFSANEKLTHVRFRRTLGETSWRKTSSGSRIGSFWLKSSCF